jgi:hypothetical protein
VQLLPGVLPLADLVEKPFVGRAKFDGSGVYTRLEFIVRFLNLSVFSMKLVERYEYLLLLTT